MQAAGACRRQEQMSKRDAVFWPLLALIRQTVQSHEFVGLISPDY
jgi:hypothetical protein